MKVVADTSPIHYLILIDQTDLLAGLFGRVFVPTAVEAELRHPSAPAVVRRTIAERPNWLETVLFKVDPTQPPVVGLHAGERDAILLADFIAALVFTPSPGDDGLLRVAEILKLSLDAKLAVLSACNTGQGRPTSDGMIGLSRALISAGVPSLLVSLWPVQDEATAFLMTAFYENLEQVGDKAMPCARRCSLPKRPIRYSVKMEVLSRQTW